MFIRKKTLAHVKTFDFKLELCSVRIFFFSIRNFKMSKLKKNNVACM